MELTKCYRVASIIKYIGFGASVLAKLIESRIKYNLYYEIKDKVIEETNDGIRIIRKKQKTKVYGLDSTRDKRDLLIQILKERMESHKDKFISPFIYNELKQMEVKRSGKVEHSDNSHDDQVFSYLMALYVWYEGKDLKERYNIDKASIKTDMDVDEVITGLEEKYSSIIEEIEYIQSKDDDPTNQMLNKTMAAKGIMVADFMAKQRKAEDELLNQLLQNKAIKEAFARANHLSLDDVDHIYGCSNKNIPDSVLMNFNEFEKQASNIQEDNTNYLA